jgi:PTS HPr component phosphorylation site
LGGLGNTARRAFVHGWTFTSLLRPFIVRVVDAVEATLEIKNRLGLHLRAASTLTQALRQFSSAVTLSNGAQQVNARSDAQETLSALKSLFDAGFGEE